MSVVRTVRTAVNGDRLSAWIPVVLRAVAGVAVGPAGLMKLLAYDTQVARFIALGVPAPEAMVVLVGVVELVAALGLAVGFASRVAAVVAVQVMLAAIVFAGVAPSNAIVLAICLGIVVLGPGQYTVRELSFDWVGQLV